MKKLGVLIGVAAILLSACGSSSSDKTTNTTTGAKKLSVVVTTTQIADWVNVLAADNLSVYTILKPGVDPHTYVLTDADQVAINSADLVIENGAGLEPWFDSKIASITHNAKVINASSGVNIRSVTDTNGDPHTWMNVANGKVMISNVGKALDTLDPNNASLYDSTQRAYDSQLDGFVSSATSALGALTNKLIVTDHQAFDYFCSEFNLTCLGAAIPDTGLPALPTADQIMATAVKLRNPSLKGVFSTAGDSPAIATQLAGDMGVNAFPTADALYGDSLGASGSGADTYLSMLNYDLNAIVAALR